MNLDKTFKSPEIYDLDTDISDVIFKIRDVTELDDLVDCGFIPSLGEDKSIPPIDAKKDKKNDYRDWRMFQYLKILGVVDQKTPIQFIDICSGWGYASGTIYKMRKKIGLKTRMLGIDYDSACEEGFEGEDATFRSENITWDSRFPRIDETLTVTVAMGACGNAADGALRGSTISIAKKDRPDLVVVSPCCHTNSSSGINLARGIVEDHDWKVFVRDFLWNDRVSFTFTSQMFELIVDACRTYYLNKEGVQTRIIATEESEEQFFSNFKIISVDMRN